MTEAMGSVVLDADGEPMENNLMSHKRKGQLTVAKEWRKHLRKFWRRDFWRRERFGERQLIRAESEPFAGDEL
jgi:hypothetical protein